MPVTRIFSYFGVDPKGVCEIILSTSARVLYKAHKISQLTDEEIDKELHEFCDQKIIKPIEAAIAARLPFRHFVITELPETVPETVPEVVLETVSETVPKSLPVTTGPPPADDPHPITPTMDAKVDELQGALTNPNLSVENKYDRLLGVKSDIKQKNVPAHLIPSLFHCLRLAITHNNIHIYTAGFATLSHLLKRLFIEELHADVAAHARGLYPILLERLGDHKERVRALASQAFADLWKAAPVDIEKQVLGTALVGRNPKAKEASLTWLLSMHTSHDLLFRPYVASLVACLEDADSAVRDTAKSTVVGLFHNAPPHAKADLKREMSEQLVRKSIVAAVLTGLGLESDLATSRPASRTEPTRQHRNALAGAASLSRPASRAEPITHNASTSRPVSRAEPRTQSRLVPTVDTHEQPPAQPAPRAEPTEYTASTSRPASRAEPVAYTTSAPAVDAEPATNPLRHARAPAAPQSNTTELKQRGAAPTSRGQEGEQLQPLPVSSARELEDIVKAMLPHFDGRETEANWLQRDRSVTTLRRLTLSNGPHEYSMAYVASIRIVLDGVFKVVNSLRTQLSTSGCRFVQEMARACGPRIDSMVEIIMLHMVKLCAGMKKITAALGNETVDIVLQNVSYTSRILQHVTAACEERNVQLRVFSAGWLKTIINKQAHHKSTIEHGGGADTLARCIKKGLSDANPGVREAMRSTFWAFARVWPARSDTIMSNLDSKSRTLLEKDPSRPGNVESTSSKVANPQKRTTTSTPSTPGRSALREAIAAQKKAHLGNSKPLPPRPETAQAALTQPKPQKSTLSSAPVRRGVRMPRPATAGPGRRPAPNELRHESPRSARSTVKTPSPTKSTFANGASGSPQVAPKSTPKSILVKRPEGIKIPERPVTPDSKSPKSPGVRFLDEVRAAEEKALATKATEADVGEVNSPVKAIASKPVETKAPEGLAAPAQAVERVELHASPEANKTDESDDMEDMQILEKQDSEDSEEIVLTAEEMKLGDLHVPKQRIRRRTHQGELDSNDPLTRRWMQLNSMMTKRRIVSTRSQELKNARASMEYAIIHIQNGDLDMFAYRKIQAVIAYHDELFETKDRYSIFLMVVLEDLARDPHHNGDPQRIRSSVNHKLQVLKAVRFMFAYNEIWFADNHAEVMSALVRTRNLYQSSYYLFNALRQVADDLLYACHLPDLVNGVVSTLRSLPDDFASAQGVAMAMRFLTKTFKVINKRQVHLQDPVLSRAGRYAIHCMNYGHIIARKEVGALCQQIRTLLPDDDSFWNLCGEPKDPVKKSMISYYNYKMVKGLAD